MSPGAPEMLGATHPAYSHTHRMYPMPQMPHPQTDEMYQEWLKNHEYGHQHPQVQQGLPRAVDVPAFQAGGCRVQTVAWQGQLEEFNTLCEMQNGLDGNSGKYAGKLIARTLEPTFVFYKLQIILKFVLYV